MYTSGGLEAGNLIYNLIRFGLSFVGLAGGIYVLVDASRRPEWAFQASRQNRGLWIGLGIGAIPVSFCCCGVLGIALAIVYHFSFRPKVVAAEQNGFFMPPGFMPGYQPPPSGQMPGYPGPTAPGPWGPPPPPSGWAPPNAPWGAPPPPTPWGAPPPAGPADPTWPPPPDGPPDETWPPPPT